MILRLTENIAKTDPVSGQTRYTFKIEFILTKEEVEKARSSFGGSLLPCFIMEIEESSREAVLAVLGWDGSE